MSPMYVLKAKSMTQPAAILAAGAVCNSFHVVSESMPTPPQPKRTKLFMGSVANFETSSFCLFKGFVP